MAGGSRSWLPRAKRTLSGATQGERLYAVGDVHGRRDLLETLAERIVEDAAGRAYALILLGDYVDRGPDSAGVLEWLVCLRRSLGDRVCLLKGNHEEALLRFIDEPSWGEPWLERFGGAATLRSYCVTPPPPGASPAALAEARDRLLENMPAAHLRLLYDLDVMALAGDYAFVHAGISPDAPLAAQSEDDLLWVREAFLEAPGPFEKIIVHGHTWRTDQPVLLGHRIGLDTGAYETGVLTAMRLEEGERVVIQALDETAQRRAVARPSVQAPVHAPVLVSRPADYVSVSAEPALSLPGRYA